MSDIKTVADLETEIKSLNRDLKTFFEKAEGELKEAGKVSTDTKGALEKIATKAEETFQRLDKLEARMNTQVGLGENGGPKIETFGAQFLKSEGFTALSSGRQKTARMDLKSIVNATQNTLQPLVQGMRVPGIIKNPDRRLTVRDLLPSMPTTSNLIEYTVENVFTNSAGPQYVSPARENVLKPESNITFTLATAPVVTLAHFILASKQVLADAPMLQAYIDSRLTYGLKLEEEDELLNGLGTVGTLNGLINQAADYNRATTGDTYIDTLRRAITQGQLSEYSMTGFVLNPEDWEAIELTKNQENSYIFANPGMIASPMLWGRPVVATNSIAAGTFLTGAFDMGASIWDREQASVAVSLEDGDNFKKNMVTILAEERLALTVFRPAAFVNGGF